MTTAAATTCSTTWATPDLSADQRRWWTSHCAADTERPATASAVHNGTRSRAGPVVGGPPADPYGFRWRAYVRVCVRLLLFPYPSRYQRALIERYVIPRSQLMRRARERGTTADGSPIGGRSGGRADNATAAERPGSAAGDGSRTASGFWNEKTRRRRRSFSIFPCAPNESGSPILVFCACIAADRRLDAIIFRRFPTIISRLIRSVLIVDFFFFFNRTCWMVSIPPRPLPLTVHRRRDAAADNVLSA